MNKIKNTLTISLFCIMLFSFSILMILLPDNDVSSAERRKLLQTNSFTETSIFSKEYSEKLENYLLDQFPIRETFRAINSKVRYYLLKQKDVNGLWIENDSIFKNTDKFDKKQTIYGAGVINKLKNTLFNDNNVYYSVIPDKNYFLKDNNGNKRFDYETQLKLLSENLKDIEYIDIFSSLNLDDYYKTDTHWSQDKIYPVVEKLAASMGVVEKITPLSEYKVNSLYPFYGVYYGQAVLGAKPDTLYYLTNNNIENTKVTGISPDILKNVFGIEDTLSDKVYSIEKFDGMDGYDIFLSGAQPVVTMECANAQTDKELVIFRDSFTSSLAPLFIGAYSKIILIDLRYIPSSLLNQYVDFSENCDVLFLYSTSMINSSMLIR